MVDIVSTETRSRMMSGIRGRNTRPELLLRSALHAQGLRFRLHVSDLPGRPDLVFPKYRAVIQVHGCFWHGHDCHLFRWPGTRQGFWRDKIASNIARDRKTLQALQDQGWRVADVWECQLRGKGRRSLHEIVRQLTAFLGSDSSRCVIGVHHTVAVETDE